MTNRAPSGPQVVSTRPRPARRVHFPLPHNPISHDPMADTPSVESTIPSRTSSERARSLDGRTR